MKILTTLTASAGLDVASTAYLYYGSSGVTTITVNNLTNFTTLEIILTYFS